MQSERVWEGWCTDAQTQELKVEVWSSDTLRLKVMSGTSQFVLMPHV
jgi:hypothetical protein